MQRFNPLRRRGRPPFPGPITPAEQRVLDLVREGLPNAEIAERLGVSVSAVKYHVSNMLSKLGLASREELAAWDSAAANDESSRRWAWVPALRAPGTVLAGSVVLGAFGAVAVLATVLALRLKPEGSQTEAEALMPQPATAAVTLTPTAASTAAVAKAATWTVVAGSGDSIDLIDQAVAPDGTVVALAGRILHAVDHGRAPRQDIFLAAVSPDGALRWTRTYGSPGSDRPRAMALRSDGGVYVVGSTNGRLGRQAKLGRSDGFVASFDPEGAPEWVRLVGSPSNDVVTSAAALSDGGVVVMASIASRTVALSMDPSGDPIWRTELPFGGWRYPPYGGLTVSAIGPGGTVFAAGVTQHPGRDGVQLESRIVALSRDGELQWTDRFDLARIRAIRVGEAGIAILGATFEEPPLRSPDPSFIDIPVAGTIDAFAVAYGFEGSRRWVRILGTAGRDVVRAVAPGATATLNVAIDLGIVTGTFKRGKGTPTLPGFEATG
jgi:DNA-binding CsgD family transcriptional regulator